MAKNLVIVESPAKSKTIEKYLGKDFRVLSSKGHIRDLTTTGKYGLGVDIDNNFTPSYAFIAGKKKLVDDLKKEVKASDKVYLAYGNHEVIDYDTYPQIFYAMRQHNDDVVYGDVNKSYFYVDNQQQKIRYIVLTAFGVQEQGVTPPFVNEFMENPAQLDWLMGTALDLSSEWTAVIFIHGLFMISPLKDGSKYSPKLNITDFNSRKVAYGEAWPFENVWLDAITHYSSDKIGKVIDYDPRPLDGQGNIDESLAEEVTVAGGIPAIADKVLLYSPDSNNTYNKYIARVKWNGATQSWRLVWTSYGTYIATTSHNVGDEIVLWKGFEGKIAGVLQGHVHADRMHIENGIPFILSSCDKWRHDAYLTTARVAGSLTEQHFEVAILDKNLQKWTLISIGAPANGGFDDTIGNEVQVREVEYE